MSVLLFVVAACGGVGAGLRYLVDTLVQRAWKRPFPLGILLVNVSGSFALGVLTGLGSAMDGPWSAALGVGFLGGYTTFSTVSVETILEAESGNRLRAAANAVGTAVAAVAAATLGWLLGTLGGVA